MSAELKIKETLPVLACNFEQLKTWATELAERYAGIVVTEDAIAEVKRDMAEINRAKKAVDDARKEAVRRVSEPIRAFEAQIKEVCAIFDSAYSRLGDQVKTFEDAQREEKRKSVEGLIMASLHNAFGPFERGKPCPLQIPIQDKWLNKTTSLKSVKEDVAAIIQRHIEEEQRRKALEQAKQDRAAAIENHVVVLNKMRGLNLPLSRFLGGNALALETPLANVLRGVEEAFAIETQKRAQQASSAAPNTVCQSPALAHQSPQSVTPESGETGSPAPAQTRAMSVVFEYALANEAQVKACLETLKKLCVNFGARYRQE